MHVIELSREMSQAWLGKSFVSSSAAYSLSQAVNDHLLFIKIQHQVYVFMFQFCEFCT